MKRYNLKNFHLEGEKDIEIEIDKKQTDYLNECFKNNPDCSKVIFYLNEELKP